MKKLLIISSEPLHPDNVLSSVFELTQAQVLQESFHVAILSVRNGGSSIVLLKKLIKNVLKFRLNSESATLVLNFIKSLLYSTFRLKMLNKYELDGVSVYEALSYTLGNPTGFIEEMETWTTAGNSAFLMYRKEHGLPNVVHAHGRFLFAGWLALSLKKTDGIPFVYTEHSTYYQARKAPLESKHLLEQVVEGASAFIAVSQSLLNHVEKFVGHPLEKSVIVPNVLNKIFEEPLKPKKSTKKSVMFITIASLEPKKGIDILLKAFQIAFKGNTSFFLTIVGEGSSFVSLKGLAAQLKLGHQVTFLGNQNKVRIKELLDDSDAFVLASRIETFGVVVIEALSRGLPVIATRSGGPEFIITDSCGILVDPENEEKFANALDELSMKLHECKPEAIRKYALDNFGTQSFLTKMKSIYQLTY